ncbi:zinc finger protein, putative [Bodo saltans]|uniref:RING-type E3 ubiquitin transferase n=1 Tax=Bodo saltans TaxID=75058 RepID=A0A0S4JKP0_BODSA|nr:zinc finger protein, putative [Bodo saltans]|eukprot:CUG89035.1 zinc finger protein, putative [Bodo saltans]
MGNQCCTNNNTEADGRNEEIGAASPLPPRTRRSSSSAVSFEDDPSIISTHFLVMSPPPPPSALRAAPHSFETLPSRQRWFERARERQAQLTQDRQQRAADETDTSESTTSPSSARTSPVVAGDLSPQHVVQHPLEHVHHSSLALVSSRHRRNAPIARRHSGVLPSIADMAPAGFGQRAGGAGPPMDPTLIALQSLAARLRTQQDDGERVHNWRRRDEDEIVRGLEAFVRMLVAGGTPDGRGGAAGGAPHVAGDDGRARWPRLGGGTGVMRRGEVDFYTFTQVFAGAPLRSSGDLLQEVPAEAARGSNFTNEENQGVGHLATSESPAAAPSSAYVDCCICMMEYSNGDVLRVLPCLHRFHKDCADKWLCDSKSACPICRECPKELTERNQRMQLGASSQEDEGGNIDNEFSHGPIDPELDEEEEDEEETRREAATSETSRQFGSSISLGLRSAESVRITFVEPELD